MSSFLRVIVIFCLFAIIAACGGGGSGSADDIPVDTDGDGISNLLDDDDDNDGVLDINDSFPLDDSESSDIDADGIGDNTDNDNDNDGVDDVNDVFPLDPSEYADADNDGLGNNADSDDDNDGVNDVNDAFPYDALESVDTDLDGLGNNADNDDDNDGVEDASDTFPLDSTESSDADADGIGDNADAYNTNSLCHLALDGDGDDCYITLLFPDGIEMVKHRGNLSYIWFRAQSKVLVLNHSTGHFLEPFILDDTKTLVDFDFSSELGLLFVAYDDDTIVYFDDSTSQSDFLSLSSPVRKVFSVGPFLIVESDYELYLYDRNGQLTDSINSYSYSQSSSYAWDNNNDRLFYIQNIHLNYIDINIISGEFAQSQGSIFDSTNLLGGPITIAPSGNQLLMGSGHIYELPDIKLKSNFSPDFIDAQWTNDDELVLLSYVSGQSLITRYDSDNRIVEQVEYSGYPLFINKLDDEFIIFTRELRNFSLHTYQPSSDSDNDGVDNLSDDYPLDVSASVDSDNDGYPDAWNDGYSELDSTTNLTLDAFPDDSACWLSSHSTEAGGCDYAATMPVFTPDQTFIDENGVVYLFSEQNQAVYRWSVSQSSFINPIYVGETSAINTTSPSFVTYSSAHQRLYFAYDSGEITFVDSLSPNAEHSFATVSQRIYGLASVGEFLLVENGTHTIFDRNGVVTTTGESFFTGSNSFVWNDINSRVYFTRSGTSPNDIHYEEIDQITGDITQSDDSPYHGDYSIRLPIVISNDGNLVLLGSGDLYDANDLTWQGSVGDLDFAVWQENDDLLTVDQYDNRFTLTRQNTDFTVVEYLEFDGTALGVLKSDSYTVVVREDSGVLIFDSYIPNDDSDNDGVDNLSDDYPLDVSASVDSDNDGYPDAWNDGYSELDSTTSLLLDAFPDDSACWLSSHSTDAGGCDYGATMPVFTPDQTFIDEHGVVYLFSEQNQAVYRWSVSQSSFINPIYVGETSAINTTSPSLVTYSSVHQRLYFAYDSGEITFVDTLSPDGEEAFARTASAIGGLVAVGNFVLAQDDSGAWNTHYIFDENGVQTDSEDWNRYSREYAWNEVNNRVYFFRDSTSPNDLHFEEIDQVTGEITAEGETPYHGDYIIRPPIVISNDGNLVLLGSGDLYDANDLTWQGSVGDLDFAVWQENDDLLTVDQYDNRFTLTRQNTDFTVVEYLEFDGTALGVLKSDSYTVVVREDSGVLIFDSYIPNDDSDNDGVDNLSDDYPLDVSASVDSDNDGYPDAWNDGYSELDSTTSLLLDAFPDDSACWLSSHSTDAGGCDYGATMPVFTPDQTFIDEHGVVYLFSEQNQAVYRWSVSQSSFINPIYVGETSAINTTSPSLVTYSSVHQRLYFAYDSGEITFVDTLSPDGEEAFARTASAIGGLVAVGNFVLAQDDSGAWNTHYIFDENGVQTDSEDWNRYSREYAWNEVNNRVYFFRDSTSPNDLHFEEIDQVTGEITAEGETPYHSSSNIRLPIRVIDSGEKILLGSGVIYDAESLEQVNNLNQNINDAAEFYDFVATLRELNQEYLVELRSYDDFTVFATFSYDTDIIAIHAFEETLVLVSNSSEGITIANLFLADNDGDLLPAWWEVQYGLSDDFDDSSLDLDQDGVTNLDEFIFGSNPSSSDSDDDGLSDFDEISVYLTSPINTDSDMDGLNDSDELTIYNTNPISRDSDADGFSDSQEIILYLTDPNDSLSVPSGLSDFIEDFDEPFDSTSWLMSDNSDEGWQVSDNFGSQLNRSLRSGNIFDNESSGVTFSALFPSGILSFDALVDAESCCDKLYVFVDDVLIHVIESGDVMTNFEMNITEGERTIEWRYQKDGSISSGQDAAWIDNVQFQVDSI